MEFFSAAASSKLEVPAENMLKMRRDPSVTLVKLTGKLNLNTISRPIQVPTIEKTASDLAIETNNRLYANKVLPEKQTGFLDNTEADLNQLYSCDELDTLWLKRYNRQKGTRIAIATLEKVLNEFEDAIFEYLYENHLMNLFESQPFENAPSYQDTLCQICFGADSEDGNPIIICDGCDVSVHQFCYGIPEIPKGPWLCKPCSYGHCKPLCYLCGNDIIGAFTSMKSKEIIWAHNTCALWIPECIFEDLDYIKDIKIVKSNTQRRMHKCSICHRAKHGLSLKCCADDCNKWMHVSCAFSSNYPMICYNVSSEEDIIRKNYCLDHAHLLPKIDENSGKVLTSYPPAFSKHSNQDLLASLFYSWAQNSIDRSAILRRTNLKNSFFKSLLHYWILKRKHFNFKSLKPSNFIDKSKQLTHFYQYAYLYKRKMILARHVLERLRNTAYLVIRRERLKADEVQLRKREFELFLPKKVFSTSTPQKKIHANDDLENSKGLSPIPIRNLKRLYVSTENEFQPEMKRIKYNDKSKSSLLML